MANFKTPQKKTNTGTSEAAKEVNLIDIYFNEFNQAFPQNRDKWISGAAILLILFSVLGLAWCVPFPKLSFLGKYNGYFNWASFLIAFYVIYYYFKLSPLYSYIILLVLFALSYGATALDQWHQHGGPAVWLISFIALVMGLVILIAVKKREAFISTLKFVLTGPACLLKLWL